MGKKTLILVAFLFLALAAFGSGQPPVLVPGVPVLIELPAQRMLVRACQGDPDTVAGPAYDRLFKAFRAQAARAEKRNMPAPRARWARVDSDKASYLTLIRFRVERIGEAPQPLAAQPAKETTGHPADNGR